MNEHSPLSALDEYPIHQFPQPVRIVATSDPRAYERYWFTAQDEAQQFLLVMGFGYYPNLGTADAYAIFVHDGRHTTVRAHRLLGDDRTVMRTGPLQAEIIEPFRQWRLRLDDNDEDLTVDVRWHDTKRAVFHRMAVNETNTNSHGRLSPEMVGYESFGRIEGTVRRGGRTFTLSPATTTGSRDHHWGVRDGVGGHIVGPPRTRTHVGQWVEFSDWSVWDRRILFNLGDERQGAQLLEPFDYRMKFDPETKHLLGGVIRNRMPDGSVREIRYEPIGDLVAYLRCAMYFGVGGGTPEENYFQGSYVGDDVTGGETYDLGDPKTRERIGGFEDRLVTATCDGERTVGILECRNPLLYDMCREGIPGYGFLD
jgi:hypothetical protein